MFKRLLAFAVLTCAVTASAQTVTYTRPSKGKTLTVFDNVPLNPAIQVNPLVSAVFDWTAFTAVQIRVDVSKNGTPVNPLTQCGYQPIVAVLGATEPGTPTFIQTSDPSARLFIDTTGFTYTVGNLSPYIKFTLGDELAFGPMAPDCAARVTVVPFPVDQNYRSVGGLYSLNAPVKLSTLNPNINGGLTYADDIIPIPSSSANPLVPTYNTYIGTNGYGSGATAPTLLTSGGTTTPLGTPKGVPVPPDAPVTVGNAVAIEVFNSSSKQGYYPMNVTVENVGTVPALCSILVRNPTVPVVVTATNYSFILKGSSVAKDGTGGTKTFHSFTQNYTSVQCITAAGSTDIAVLPF